MNMGVDLVQEYHAIAMMCARIRAIDEDSRKMTTEEVKMTTERLKIQSTKYISDQMFVGTMPDIIERLKMLEEANPGGKIRYNYDGTYGQFYMDCYRDETDEEYARRMACVEANHAAITAAELQYLQERAAVLGFELKPKG